MKRISPDLTHFYIKLEPSDPYRCRKSVAFTLTPSKEPEFKGWEDVTYYGEGILDPTLSIRKPEWVYVLVNKSMPGICKIGMTTTSVGQRVKEINYATGVITPWFSVFKYKCINSLILEQAVHQHLEEQGYRVNPKREGFEIDSQTAIDVIKELGEKLTVVSNDFGNTLE
jgi:hypothetical protein